MTVGERIKRNITRTIEDISVAFRFYSIPERWRGNLQLYAMARPSGIYGNPQGTPEEYVHLLIHYRVRGVINFDGGYRDENRPYYEAARSAGINVNTDPNNAIPDRHNDTLLSWLLNALIVIDSVQQRNPGSPVCINCAAGQGRSGTIMAAWMIREAVRSGEVSLDQELNAQAFGSLQPSRLVAVYPIVQQVIAALREQQQRQSLRASAVEGIMQVCVLNRYYEYLVREKNKRRIINKFQEHSAGGGSLNRSRSENDRKYGMGFWSTFGSNILEYFLHGTRHLRTGSDVIDSIAGLFSSLSGIEISKRSVSRTSSDIKYTLLPRGADFAPFVRAIKKIEPLLARPDSWPYQGRGEPMEITVWLERPFAQVFYTRVHGGEFQRIYISFDFSPIADMVGLSKEEVLALSGQEKERLLRKCKIIDISWFVTALSGTKGHVGTFMADGHSFLEDTINLRIINEFNSSGNVGVEYEKTDCWVLGKFMPPDMPWSEELLGERPLILFATYKEHTNMAMYLIPGLVTGLYEGEDGLRYLSTPLVEWAPERGQGLARLAGVTVHATRSAPHLVYVTLKTSDPNHPITMKVEQTGVFEDEEFEFHLLGETDRRAIGPLFHTFNFFLKKMPMFVFTCKNREGEDIWSVESETSPASFWRESGDLYHVYDLYHVNDVVLFAGYLLAKNTLADDPAQYKAGRKESWVAWRKTHIVDIFQNDAAASWSIPPAVLTMGDGSRALVFTKEDMELFDHFRSEVDPCLAVWEEENTYGVLYIDHHGRVAAWDVIGINRSPNFPSRYKSGYFNESGRCHVLQSGESLEHQLGSSVGISKAIHFPRLTKTDENLTSVGCSVVVAENIQPLANVIRATDQIEKFGKNWLSAFKRDSTDFWNMAAAHRGKILFHENRCFSLALDSMQLHSLFPTESFDRSSVNTNSYEALGMAYFDQRGRVVGVVMADYNFPSKNTSIFYTYNDNVWEKVTNTNWLSERERTGSWSPSSVTFSVLALS